MTTSQTPPVPPAPQNVPASSMPAAAPMPPSVGGPYRDDELVYVDPETKTVVGRIEWTRNGNPKSKPYIQKPAPDAKPGERRRGSGRKHYPWGTYKSMKGAFKLEGKQRKADNSGKTLEDVMEKALKEPFWN